MVHGEGLQRHQPVGHSCQKSYHLSMGYDFGKKSDPEIMDSTVPGPGIQIIWNDLGISREC